MEDGKCRMCALQAKVENNEKKIVTFHLFFYKQLFKIVIVKVSTKKKREKKNAYSAFLDGNYYIIPQYCIVRMITSTIKDSVNVFLPDL